MSFSMSAAIQHVAPQPPTRVWWSLAHRGHGQPHSPCLASSVTERKCFKLHLSMNMHEHLCRATMIDLHNLLSCTSRISSDIICSKLNFHSCFQLHIPKQWHSWCLESASMAPTPNVLPRLNAFERKGSMLPRYTIAVDCKTPVESSVNHFNDGLWQVKMWSGCVVESSSGQT